ncbi:MAG: hypothetical protein M3R02_19885 [Chloroflexota bacterium]|nr:hypothetical protein [Chloroflexota bacterium]
MDDSITLSVPIELDDEGYWDRQCPWEDCGRAFKVLFEDWKAKVPDEVARYPFCGYEAEPTAFNTPEQAEYLRQVAMAEVQRQIGQMLGGVASDFNRRMPKRGLVTMRMDVSSPPIPVLLQPAAQEQMTLRITCERCECRFAVVGAGFFCPACGHNSADHTFDQAVTAARNALQALPDIRAALGDRDAADQVTRHLIEAQIGNLVMAFQRFAEASFPRLPGYAKPPRRNAFQNLAEGEQLWAGAGGTGYSGILSAGELAQLQRLFQQRHLLAHREGIVDAEYLTKSGDQTYAVGQRLVVREAAVLRLSELLEKLVAGLRRDLAAMASSAAPSAASSGNEASPPALIGPTSILPQVAGLTNTDLRVFQLAAEEALASGDAEIGGQVLWNKAQAASIDREAFDEAVEILTSKQLVSAAWPTGQGALPALVSLSLRGRDALLRHVLDNYAGVRRQVACEIVQGVTASGQIQATVAQPKLVVDHVISDFASRGWVAMQRVGGELYVADPTVELKRLCRES